MIILGDRDLPRELDDMRLGEEFAVCWLGGARTMAGSGGGLLCRRRLYEMLLGDLERDC